MMWSYECDMAVHQHIVNRKRTYFQCLNRFQGDNYEQSKRYEKNNGQGNLPCNDYSGNLLFYQYQPGIRNQQT